MTSLRRPIALAVVSLAALTACGGADKVGDDDLLAFDQEQANQLGASSTTDTTAGSTEAAAATDTTAAPAPTAPAPTTTLPPEQQEVTVEVTIQDDEQGAPFTPNVVRVAVGGKVRFVNKGAKTYSIVAQDGSFASPPIAPGAAWIYDATTPGSFNYSDDVRTYSQGTIQVVG